MTAMLTAAHSEMTSRPLPHDSCSGRGIQLLTKEEFDRVLRALEIPFEANLVQWRVTERSDDEARGLMMAYADPRAYSHRLNSLFTPAGWTRRYTVRARKKPRPVGSKGLLHRSNGAGYCARQNMHIINIRLCSQIAGRS
jgi:hypothetical protein